MKNLFVKCDSFLAHSSNCDPHNITWKRILRTSNLVKILIWVRECRRMKVRAKVRRCACSSKNVAILSLWSKRAIIAPNNLIDSHHYKRHKKIRMTEFHSPSLSILIITQSKASFLVILNYSRMIPRLVEYFRNLHLFHSNATKT